MLAVFDSSALVKLLVEEDGSELAARLWDEADAVVTSRLAVVEVPAALHAARRHDRLDGASLEVALTLWAQLLRGLPLLELTEALADRAAELTSHLVLGGADAVHLAGALQLSDADPVLVVWDRRLHKAALASGLRAAPAAL